MPGKQTTMSASREASSTGASPNMSALELAVQGKYRASGTQEMIRLEMDAADEDWTPLVRRARQNGPGSWFASKVDFTFNSARFIGKVGYPVQGGVFPLFDGAVMDVGDAEMRAEKPENAEPDPRMEPPTSYKNWVTGVGGLLVLAPAHADNIVPVRTDKFVVTESSITATAVKDLEFRRGELTIHAKRMDLSNQMVILYDVAVWQGNEDKSEDYQEIAAISGEGLSLFPALVKNMPGRQPDLLERAGKTAEGSGGISENLSAGKETEDQTNDKQEDPLWTQIAEALKKESKEQIKEALFNLLEGDLDGAAKVFEDKWEQLKSIYDGFSSEDLQESWLKMPDKLKEIFTGKITKEDEIKAYLEKLAPTDQLVKFLGMGEDNDKALDNKESKSGAEIPLASIVLFPGLADFSILLKPAYHFSAYAKADAKNLYSLWNTKADAPAKLSLTAGIKGSLSLRAVAELAVGIPFLLKGFANLYAEAGLNGSLTKGETESAMLEAQVIFPVKRKPDGSFAQDGNLEGSLEGGLKLSGSVGTEGGIRSGILMWEKKLFEKEFGRWTLGAIHALIKVSKQPTGGIFSGWSLNEASLAISGPETGFGAAFQENNTPEKKYGLYDPEIKESGKYAQIHEDFMYALEMLKQFASGSTDSSLIISTQQGEGVNQILDTIEEIRSQFVLVWADGLREQEILLLSLDELENSGKYQREMEKTQESINKHSNRIYQVERMRGFDNTDVLQAYTSISDPEKRHRAGGGYQKAMEEQAREKATDFDSIVAYERNRYQEVIKPHQNAIALVESLQNKEADGNPLLSDAEILSLYKERAGNEIEKHRALFQDSQAIIRFEEEQIRKKQGEKSSPDTYYQKIEELKDKSQSPEEFALAYLKKISNIDAIPYGTPALLLEYEKNFVKKTGALAEEFDQIQENRKKIEDQSMTEQEAMEQFGGMKKKKGAKNPPELIDILGSDLYRTASIDDLLEVELGSSYTALRDYLAGDAENPSDAGSIMADQAKKLEIFGKKGIKEAEKQYEAYIRELHLPELIPHMTIEMLWDYVCEEKVNEREFSYVRASRVKIQELSKKPEDARKAELEAIEQYFSVFSGSRMAGRRKQELAEGKETDLSMMLKALESGAGKTREEQDRIDLLREAKKDGESSYSVMKKYLDAGGDKKAVFNHQKEKAKQGRLTMEDIARFYEDMLSEKTYSKARNFAAEKSMGIMQKKASHYERWVQMNAMAESNVPYEDMIEAYRALGGGDNYGKYVKEKIKAGLLKDGLASLSDGLTTFGIDKVMETERKKRDKNNLEVNRRNARIDLVRKMEGEGKNYLEILAAYEQRARTDQEGKVGEVKALVSENNLLTLKTEFEKSQKGEIKASDILVYERIAMKKDGEKHAERLRFLLGLPAASEEFLTAPLPTDDAVRMQRRADYLQESKRFKKSKAVEASANEHLQQLLNRPAEEQRESILAYERERNKHYWEEWTGLEQKKQRLEAMREHLDSMAKICHTVTFNIQDIRQNPGNLWEKIEQFQKDMESVRLGKEKEERNQKERAEIGKNLEQLKKKTEEAEEDGV